MVITTKLDVNKTLMVSLHPRIRRLSAGEGSTLIVQLAARTFSASARFNYIDLNTLTEGAMSMVSRVLMLMLAIGVVAGCSNTIRGVGQDTANVVDATQSAGENVGNSAAY